MTLLVSEPQPDNSPQRPAAGARCVETAIPPDPEQTGADHGESAEKGIVVGKPPGHWVFYPSRGYDLTRVPCVPDEHAPRLTLATSTVPITISPEKTALVVVDMQNFFLSPAFGRGAGSSSDEPSRTILDTAIPSARKAGIQILHLTWGIAEDDLAALPPVLYRCFGFRKAPGIGEFPTEKGIGDDLGAVGLQSPGDGGGGEKQTVDAGRMLLKGQWNTALYPPFQDEFNRSQGGALPDVRFDKTRLSGFWGGSDAEKCIAFLREKGITTLLFTGVKTNKCVFSSLHDASNLGFDVVLLTDGCKTTDPDYTREMVEFNTVTAMGFVSTCHAFEEGVQALRCTKED